MAKQTINIGTTANDGTGDPLRTAFDKINDNFSELYNELGGDNLSTLTFDGNNIKATQSNDDIKLIPSGTGKVNIPGDLDVLGTGYIYNISSTGTANLTTVNIGSLATLNTLTFASGATIDELSIDGTLTGNSDSAVPTEKAVKTYVDSQVTAQDLDFQADSGGALSIDLDSESLTIAGGTGIDTAGSSNTVTISIDSTVATLDDTQTFTNKTLTAPIISTISNTGTITLPTATTTLVGRDTTDTLTNKTLTAPIISTISNTGTLTLPTSTDTLVGRDTADTLTGKSISGNDNTLSDIGNSSLTNNDVTVGTTTVALGATALTLSGIQQLGVDNIDINGNTISATNSGGGINLTPDGAGVVTVSTTLQANRVSAATIIEVDPSNGSIDTNFIRTVSTNADLSISTGPGSGTIDFNTPTQGTVGSAGSASALPAQPTGYLKFKLNGTDIVVPYYAAS